MSPTLTSQGLVLATAMAVSAGTIILFDLLKDKYFPTSNPLLKSCLTSSGSRKRKKKGRKKVQFADDVKDSGKNGELYRRELQRGISSCEARIQKGSCGNRVRELKKMPANRVALYAGILRDRVHRMEYSY